MKEHNKTQFSFTLDRREKESLESAAKGLGMNFTSLLKEGASFYASFDPVFRKRIKTFSRNLGIQEYLVLQNLCLSWLAQREAHSEVLGIEDPTLEEFSFTEHGPITGEELFRTLKRNFVKNFEYEKEGRLRWKCQYNPLSTEDSEWLKQRLEKYEQAEKAQQKAIENRAKGLAASFSENEQDEREVLAEMKSKREKQK